MPSLRFNKLRRADAKDNNAGELLFTVYQPDPNPKTSSNPDVSSLRCCHVMVYGFCMESATGASLHPIVQEDKYGDFGSSKKACHIHEGKMQCLVGFSH